MKQIITVPIYSLLENKFFVTGEKQYTITYLFCSGKEPQHLRVVVNGIQTNHMINCRNYGESYREIILSAISDYLNGNLDLENKSSKVHDKHKFKLKLGPRAFTHLNKSLFKVNKVLSRDEQTKYNLIQ